MTAILRRDRRQRLERFVNGGKFAKLVNFQPIGKTH